MNEWCVLSDKQTQTHDARSDFSLCLNIWGDKLLNRWTSSKSCSESQFSSFTAIHLRKLPSNSHWNWKRKSFWQPVKIKVRFNLKKLWQKYITIVYQNVILKIIYSVLLCSILLDNKNAMFCCKLILFDCILIDCMIKQLLTHFIGHHFMINLYWIIKHRIQKNKLIKGETEFRGKQWILMQP